MLEGLNGPPCEPEESNLSLGETERAPLLYPVPVRLTVFVPVKVALLDTVAVPLKVPLLLGQNLTVTLAPDPFDTEKLLPEEMLKGGFGLTLTVPEAGPVPRTCWIANTAVSQVPTWTLLKFNDVGPTVMVGVL